MADFCAQCSYEHFGQDLGELAGLCEKGTIVAAICEGCSHDGACYVNEKGQCLDHVKGEGWVKVRGTPDVACTAIVRHLLKG